MPVFRIEIVQIDENESALDAIELPATDNPLPRLLHQQAGLPSRQLPRSAATLLDVDTPPDATV
ncbi:MAG: hypothetical protein ABR508_11900, partial [Candidatus Baltobacteraceae bacterium]